MFSGPFGFTDADLDLEAANGDDFLGAGFDKALATLGGAAG